MISALRPGLLPIYFESDFMGLTAAVNGEGNLWFPPKGRTKDNIAIADAMNYENNSLRRFVIGPVFAPDATKEQVLEKVRVWREQYGFAFLEPLLARRHSRRLEADHGPGAGHCRLPQEDRHRSTAQTIDM